MATLGFIGMGNMASAILRGAVRSGFMKGTDTLAYDISKEKLQAMAKETGMTPVASLAELAEKSDFLLVAVKPGIVPDVFAELGSKLKGKTVISIAAGWQYARLKELAGPNVKICAVMPNTPALVGEGMALIEATNDLPAKSLKFVNGLFSALGSVEMISSDLMGIAGALSGCAPAWVFMVIEGLADGAVMHGLPRDIAYRLAAQTVLGSGKMVRDTKEHPGKLKDDVCSPGGITIRGVKALEEGGLRIAMMNAVERAFLKN